MRTTLPTLLIGLALLPACPPDITFEDTEPQASETSASSGDPADTSTTPIADATTTTTTTTADTTLVPTTTDDETTGTTTGTTTDTDTDATTGAPTTTLCERLGGPGEGGIADLITTFLGGVRVDPRINGYFLNDDVDAGNLQTTLTDMLGQTVGCEGVVYTGLDMLTAHKGLGISDADFADFADDFSAALATHQETHPELTQADKDALLTALAAPAPVIVEDPAHDATVYQRIGRKPAIEGLIGDPEDDSSFLGIVAADAAINSFFLSTDAARLHTCLVRQLADLDGPIKYGHEVDSPGPGVDDGVSAANKCRDMVSAHAGLQDADAAPITIEDFLALVTDLDVAMDSAGITPEDKQIIITALAPLCDQIVAGEAEKNKCPGNLTQTKIEAASLNALVPDDKYNGTLVAPSMLCTTLTVPDDGINFVDSVELEFGADVTWIGDVTIKVVSPNAEVLTVLHRPTSGAPYPDDGKGGNGYGVDLQKKDRLRFRNTGATPAADMGQGLLDNFPDPGAFICHDDLKCDYKPSPTPGPGTDFNDFRGDKANGDWNVCVGDSGAGDDVTIDYVALTFNKVKFNPLP